MSEKGFISGHGLFTTLIVTVVGVGIFSYPSSVTRETGTDGWIATIFAGIVSYLLLYLIYRIVKANDYKKFYCMLEDRLGRIIGSVLALLFCIYIILSVALGMRIFSEVIKMYLLQQTPTEFIFIVILLTSTYLARGGIASVIRFNEVAFWIMFIPLAVVLMFSTRGADFTNIFPVFNSRPGDYLRALKSSIYGFAGFEIAYLVLPFVREKNKIQRTAFKAISFITILYVIVTVLCLAFFGRNHTQSLLWPTITLIRNIQIPGAFIERWEGVVMALWVVFYFTTLVNMYYFSSDIIKDVFRLEHVNISSLIVIPLIYVIALYPQNIAELYNTITNTIPYFSLYSFIILPLIIILAGKLKRKGGNKCEE